MKPHSILVATVVMSIAFNHQADAQSFASYKTEIESWHSQRVQSLKSDNGWLNVAGLYWLEEGKNTFGSSSRNQVVFPKGTITDEAGYFERHGNTVKFVAAKNVAVNVNNKPAAEAIIFSADSSRAPILSYGSLRWSVIKRSEKIGVRLRDLKSPALQKFPGIDRFTVDTSWKVTATLQTANQPGSLYITNILGQTNEQKLAGKLLFTVNGSPYALDALDEGDNLFIIFGDATNGETTYPSGRFLYAQKPDASGKIILDFNKAQNPPCAFTDYATCPLPPKQNVLQIPVTAGEKNYGHHQ